MRSRLHQRSVLSLLLSVVVVEVITTEALGAGISRQFDLDGRK